VHPHGDTPQAGVVAPAMTAPPIADFRLTIFDFYCRLPIADCRLSIVDCRLPIGDCGLPIARA
jgi:hypothetical protein